VQDSNQVAAKNSHRNRAFQNGQVSPFETRQHKALGQL